MGLVSDLQIRRAWADFAALSDAHPAIAALTLASQPRKLERNAFLLKEANEDTSVYLVVSGSLRTVRNAEDGQEVWFTDVRPGELIGEIAALTGQPRTSSVMAESRTIVLALERSAFLQIAQLHGEVGLALAALLAGRLVRTSTQVADLVALSVHSRLYRELVRLVPPEGFKGLRARIDAPPSVTDLGQRIHASREATSRALRDLEQRGMVIRSDDAWLLVIPRAVEEDRADA